MTGHLRAASGRFGKRALALFDDLEPERALVLVNCQDLRLTANRGSVGSSEANILEAVRDGVIQYLSELEDDQDLTRFREEYGEERLRRVREKDKKAFQKRLERYNRKRYHLIEANRCHEPKLAALCRKERSFSYVLAAAADRATELYFDASEPFGGVASHEPAEGLVRLHSTTLEAEVRRNGLPGPFLIKLDTHGFEVPILEGARSLFHETALFVIEAYTFQLRPESLKFYELCARMKSHGFEVIDLSEPLWRLKDNALWRLDLFFVPVGRPEMAYTGYR